MPDAILIYRLLWNGRPQEFGHLKLVHENAFCHQKLIELVNWHDQTAEWVHRPPPGIKHCHLIIDPLMHQLVNYSILELVLVNFVDYF